MRHHAAFVPILLAAALWATITHCNANADEPVDINTVMMRSTFMIGDEDTIGTVFVMAAPDPQNPGYGRKVLITAAHVLDDIKGDFATLYLRRAIGKGFSKYPYLLPIRNFGKPLWQTEPDVDVAAMFVELPEDADIQFVPTDFLATDDMLNDFFIHPGDTVSVIGYPLGEESNEAGFPILRNARIASYPILPTMITKNLLLDFPVFKGNSGGPVIIDVDYRTLRSSTSKGYYRCVIGIVTSEHVVSEIAKNNIVSFSNKNSMGLSDVVHASFARRLISRMLNPSHSKLPTSQSTH